MNCKWDAYSNTNKFDQSLPDSECLYSAMSAAFARLDFSMMEDDELLLAADYCAGTRAGLCHCLNYIGDSLVTFADNDVPEFSSESLCQLGHGLEAISLLIPVLIDFDERAQVLTRQIKTLI